MSYFQNDLESWVYIVGAILFIVSAPWFLRLSKKMLVYKKMMQLWLIPIIPIALIVALIYPKNESCGLSGMCFDLFVGISSAFYWFLFFPTCGLVYLLIKKSGEN